MPKSREKENMLNFRETRRGKEKYIQEKQGKILENLSQKLQNKRTLQRISKINSIKVTEKENKSLASLWLLFKPYFQFSSVAQSCPTLSDPMNRSTPGLPVHHQLSESTQIHVH